jgi:hypothetical protein
MPSLIRIGKLLLQGGALRVSLKCVALHLRSMPLCCDQRCREPIVLDGGFRRAVLRL